MARTERGEVEEESARDALMALFAARYVGMLRAVHSLLVRFTLTPLPPLDPAAVSRMVLDAGARAVAVDATTQRAIAATIAEGTRLGLSPRQVAYGTDDFPGIEGLFEKTWKDRPLMVARTEMQTAMLKANVDRFRATGVVRGYRASDGDWDKACAARNGQTYPLDSPPDLLHPNCRLTIAPIFSEI